MVGSSDPRHILKTLLYVDFNREGWDGKEINFYCYEKDPECHARMILLLHILNVKNLPIKGKYQKNSYLFF